MWHKLPFRKLLTPDAPLERQAALRPWGDAAYLFPHHLPMHIEGQADTVLQATRMLAREVHEQRIPIFVQEGMEPFLTADPALEVKRAQVLPPIVPGTTRTTIRQVLEEIMEWQRVRQDHQEEGTTWPALLLCSGLGSHRNTLREMVQETRGQVGFIYLQPTAEPPRERPQFASQLFCQSGGRVQLRRHTSYQGLVLPDDHAALHSPSPRRSSSPPSLI